MCAYSATASIVVPRYPCTMKLRRAMDSSPAASLPRGRPRRVDVRVAALPISALAGDMQVLICRVT
jgi:hypothetical protein